MSSVGKKPTMFQLISADFCYCLLCSWIACLAEVFCSVLCPDDWHLCNAVELEYRNLPQTGLSNQCRKDPPPELNITKHSIITLNWKHILFSSEPRGFINLIPKLTMLTLKCALWTFKQYRPLQWPSRGYVQAMSERQTPFIACWNTQSPAHRMLGDTPTCEQNDRQTDVKTLPSCNFVWGR